LLSSEEPSGSSGGLFHPCVVQPICCDQLGRDSSRARERRIAEERLPCWRAPAVSISSLANGALGEQRRAFRGGLYGRKPPPRRRHHQRSTCELLTAAKIRSPAATVICSPSRQAAAWSLSVRPAAQTRLSPTTRSRKSLVARTASAWPALLVQRGSFRDRRRAFGNGTAYRCGAFKAARIAVHRSNIRIFPTPEYTR
jgi:hypothetical protein